MKKMFLVVFILSFTVIQPQELYKSTHFKKAYESGTRSVNGSPGKNYWQNRSDYLIKADLNPLTKILNGTAYITYFNESPDTLDEIVLRLYPDFYKKGTARDWQIDSLALTNGIEIKKLTLRDKVIDLSDTNKNVNRYITNLIIKLDEPVAPDDEVEISAEYKTKIPDKFRLRMGAYEDTSFFVAYWYPQISVYDDVYGWDKLNYTGTTEMYNDFNNYEVHITVPRKFIVWATGELQNPSDVLSEEFLKKYDSAFNSDTTFNIITEADLKKGNITVDNEKNTWIYKAEQVPDFAFGTAKSYLWDGAGLKLKSGKRIFVDAAYRIDSEDFKDVVDISLRTINYLSEEMPGVEYPFEAMTIFNGSGGMEFPMIVNDGSSPNYESAVGLTSHEITHTYFPFLTGTNERRFAFMDEGWAVFLPFELQRRLSDQNHVLRSVVRYEHYARDAELVAPMVESAHLSGSAYRAAAYSQPALAYYFLEDMIGKEPFTESLQEFINRWKYKHPVPYDMFYTFNKTTGQNLNWYWQKWFFDFAHADLALKEYLNEEERKIVVENVGGLPLPVYLTIYYEDGEEEIIKTTAEIWKQGNSTYEVIINSDKNITQINLGNENIPDLDKSNSILILNEI